jgi:hypothetical protein
MIATLEFEGRTARIRFDQAAADRSGEPSLSAAAEARLS